MIVGLILACEVGFWVVIIAGLTARYALGAKRLGAVLLALAPVIDVVLLAAVVVDLSRGATASWPHGLAAVYSGLSVAYGHRMIGWADARFAHLVGRGSAPAKLCGREYTLHCWADAVRTLLAAAIAAGIIGGITWWVDDPGRTHPLSDWLPILGVIVAIDVLWAVSYTVWPRKA